METVSRSHIQELERLGMKVNIKKSEVVIFSKQHTPPRDVNLGDEKVLSKDNMKVLGVYFDSKLKWEKHIRHTIAKCNSKLSVLRKIRRKFNKEQFSKIITSQYYSVLYYCSELWFNHTTKANLRNLVRTAHYKALRILVYDFDSQKTKSELTKTCKRATPTEWSKYTQASFVIKCLNTDDSPQFLKQTLLETIFTTRRNPKKGRFFNNAKGKIGKQRISNRLKFMDELKDDWIGMDTTTGALQTMLKKSLFQYKD